MRLATFYTFFVLIISITVSSNPIAENAEKFLGNIASGAPSSNFSDYWNQLTLENNGKWGNVERSRNNMDWSAISAAYNYTRQKGFPYKQHAFVWGTQEPGWIGGLSAADQKKEVEQWIKSYGEKFPQTEMIDVVNEPLNKPPSFKNALGGSGATGWDWVIWAFETARKYCPDSKLLINEFEVEYDAKLAANYLKIIMLLKERNLIDGIGIQCHTNEIQRDKPTVQAIREALDTLASSGLPIYVSELDLKGDDNTQLADYQRLFPVFWEHPAVKGVTLWGYAPPTWISGTELISNGRERPALKWLREYVAEHKGSVSAGHTEKTGKQFTFNIFHSGRGFLCTYENMPSPVLLRIFDPQGRILSGVNKTISNNNHTILFIPQNNLSKGLYVFEITGRDLYKTQTVSVSK